MKKFLFLAICIQSFSLSAQNRRVWGFTVGANEYYASPTIASAKSGTGFSAGVLTGFRITKASELVMEANFIQFHMEFYGKDIHKVDPEWIKFHSNRVGLSALYYYDVLHFMDDDLVIGLHAGPGITYINNFTADGDNNPDYQLAPYDIPGTFMKISRYQYGSPLNTFFAAGFNVHYKDMEMNVRYNFAISSPYRDLKFRDLPKKSDGKDDYLSVSFNYYINE